MKIIYFPIGYGHLHIYVRNARTHTHTSDVANSISLYRCAMTNKVYLTLPYLTLPYLTLHTHTHNSQRKTQPNEIPCM